MKNPHAVALGRKGGQAKSEAKTAAARENGKKGGWPKGKKRNPVQLGIEIPQQLRPLIKQLADSGPLLDEDGKKKK